MNLRESTKSLHHRAEQTPFGESLSNGTVDAVHWANWLGALLSIHSVIDPTVSPIIRRTSEIIKDLHELEIAPRFSTAAARFALSIESDEDAQAAVYVLTGAHLMGGAITHKRLDGRLPSYHLQWGDRQEAIREWSPLRERAELAGKANKTFEAIIEICHEIT